MAKIYTVRANGKIFKIRGPEGATAEQLQAIAQQQAPPQPEPSPQPTFGERLREAAGPAITRAVFPITGLPEAMEAIQKPFDVAGEKVATTLAEKTPITPEGAAAIGVPIQMLPDIALSVLGGSGARAGVRGAKSFLQAGKRIGEAEKAAGIVKELPETAQLAEKLGLAKRTKLSSVLNKIESQIDKGEKLGGQLLTEARLAVKKAFGEPAFRDPELRSILARQSSKIQQALNEAIAGRAQPAADLAKIKRGKEIAGKVLRGAGKVAKGAAVAGGLGAIGKILFGG